MRRIGILLAFLALMWMHPAQSNAIGTYSDDTYTTWGVETCPFRACYDNVKTTFDSPLVDAGTGTFTDSRGKTGNDIGYWQHSMVVLKVVRKFLPIFGP